MYRLVRVNALRPYVPQRIYMKLESGIGGGCFFGGIIVGFFPDEKNVMSCDAEDVSSLYLDIFDLTHNGF